MCQLSFNGRDPGISEGRHRRPGRIFRLIQCSYILLQKADAECEGTSRALRLLEKQEGSCGSALAGVSPDPCHLLGHSSSRTFLEQAESWKVASPAYNCVCHLGTVLACSSVLPVVSI